MVEIRDSTLIQLPPFGSHDLHIEITNNLSKQRGLFSFEHIIAHNIDPSGKRFAIVNRLIWV